jgi:type II secretory pathway pseudopilin PulG
MHDRPETAHRAGPDGFGLVEVVIAIGLVVTFAAGVLPLFATTHGALAEAHEATICVVLARSKLDQLRSLSWTYRAGPSSTLVPVTDTTTNLATDPPTQSGSGLQPSPPDALWTSTPGYVDFADDRGAWLAGAPATPPEARYVRRWAVATLPDDAETLVLQVRVVPIRGGSTSGEAAGTRRGETWLVTLETRTRP